MKLVRSILFAIPCLASLWIVASLAQQPPAGGQGKATKAPTAPPPINWPSPPLADGPIISETALQRQIRLVVTKGLNQPWSMAFLPDGAILVTERGGRRYM
jgi:glucose/arabinose dehydrogenase